ncbi:CpsD/CapB family tyrosine-protein kinase [Lacrimispora sp. NSJ-141]|uniref:non-specific protein-tyrosine kinase n=1 Tax=Lientehia hominis TaxID=2897778 RepID=A0AAP2RIE8_9FIRM|nr:CpsD/CapB family tyrosine-protein kinase [Lientehia hominis]MCD2492291.1 CpsD/CapB family tyrosine-protein kinase [Lientehia hominis]
MAPKSLNSVVESRNLFFQTGKTHGDFRTQEAFKTLRSNIQFCGSEFRTIVFTSCIPNEGKSHVSYMTAAAFAELGKKVLFIDADLRKSVLRKRLHQTARKTKGLSHFLSGQAALSEIVCPSETIDNMSLVFTGPFPPNPAELLSGEMFRLGLARLEEQFDYIFLDAPPVGSVIDAAIIAKECDGVILVIAANMVSYRIAQSVKAQLDKTDCKILGTVLNKVDMKEHGYYGQYYGQYYGD